MNEVCWKGILKLGKEKKVEKNNSILEGIEGRSKVGRGREEEKVG